jgi:hypothetical protein
VAVPSRGSVGQHMGAPYGGSTYTVRPPAVIQQQQQQAGLIYPSSATHHHGPSQAHSFGVPMPMQQHAQPAPTVGTYAVAPGGQQMSAQAGYHAGYQQVPTSPVVPLPLFSRCSANGTCTPHG